MNYLILGEYGERKEAKIQSLKQQFLQSPESVHFDYEDFSGEKLDAQLLRKALLSLPVAGNKRVVLVRSFDGCDDKCIEMVSGLIAVASDSAVLILEAENSKRLAAFIRKNQQSLEIVDFSKEKKANVFDMTDALSRKNSGEALQVLDSLLADNIHPLQVLGGIVWFWQNRCRRISAARYEKGLLFLQEADLNIKRSRLRPEYAIELLVVQLGTLLA